MPNQSDPTQNPNTTSPPVKKPDNQSAAPPNPPVVFPQSQLPPLTPEFQSISNADIPISSPKPETVIPDANQPAAGDGGSGVTPDISSVISKPKKKYGGGKIIATILGLILLIGGVGAGILLTQQKQLFQQKASGTIDCGSQTCDKKTQVCCLTGCKNIADGGCGETGAKKCNTAGNTDGDCRGQFEGFTYCSCLEGGSNPGYCNDPQHRGITRSCKAYESTGNDEYRCSNIVTGTICDNPHESPTPNPTATPTPTASPTATASPTPSPTASPTSSPTASPGAPSCITVKAYDDGWVVLTEVQLSALRPGDVVNFCVNGDTPSGTFDKAQFMINTTIEPETITKRPDSNDFCQPYTILSTDTTMNIKAKIHHSSGVWVGESF